MEIILRAALTPAMAYCLWKLCLDVSQKEN